MRKKNLLNFSLLLIIFTKTFLVIPSGIFLTSVPKSGTKLLQKCVGMITKKSRRVNTNDYLILGDYDSSIYKSHYIFSHAIPSAANLNVIRDKYLRGLFILRDPRDQVMSFMHHIRSIKGWGWLSSKYASDMDLVSDLIKNMRIIYGSEGWKNSVLAHLKDINTFFSLYLPWSDYDFIYTTRFEKLIGVKGGGSDSVQFEEIKRIARHIGYYLSDEEIQNIQENLFGGTATFREGKIGAWKEHFTEEHKKIFKEVAGQLLIDLGYEEDFDW